MTSTAVLRTPPASTSYRNDYISLRRPRGAKEKGFGRENSPSPTTVVLNHRVKSPSERTFGDSPSEPSPSPLRKRVLFERGRGGQRDSDDEDEASPSALRLHSPFASRCASPFLRAWGGHGPKVHKSTQPIEDDEGLFLASKASTTPTRPSYSTLAHNPCSSSNSSPSKGTSGFPKLMLTPSVAQTQNFPVLSPLQPPEFIARTPHTPAETDWHLGRQTESMTKLSLDDDDDQGFTRHNMRCKKFHVNEEELSPSLAPRRRGRKRSFDGNELPRSKGGIFENSKDTPLVTSFHIPESPSPITRRKPSVPPLFGAPTPPTQRSHLSVTTNVVTKPRSRSPSPKSALEPIAKKYKPRDSGVAGLDDEGESDDGLGPLASPNPATSPKQTSGLVTPGVEPPTSSAWPRAAFAEGQQGDVDEFIYKALAAGGAPKDRKVMPGTPVKRNAYALSRPWMSSSKVMPPPALPHAGGAPRKSLPLSFPNLSQIQNSPDASDTSPSDRQYSQRKMYGEVGKGRPTVLPTRGEGVATNAKTHFLMRRSSSGFSTSSSECSLLGTPTKPTISEYRLPVLNAKKSLPSSLPLARPVGETPNRRHTLGRHHMHEKQGASPRPSFAIPPRALTEYERPGKFERDFVTVDNIGTGVFGNVLKVRYKRGDGGEMFAIKKSKTFDGVKHRRRLREEVDVLKHLAVMGGSRGHLNVLKYVDSWEQDDTLCIQTELCELGSFGTFLAEYGTHFEALDEARVWKICAELTSGLRSIHEAGVIHLDLKPDNVFVTGEGRFRIGDFGMASLWPRRAGEDGFEREGDREYMAPEVLQGQYGKAADIFSLGMIMLETTTNIVVPDMGDDWHRLRENDFSAVDFSAGEAGSLGRPRSAELVELIQHMMRSDPDARPTIDCLYSNPIVQRARTAMECKRTAAIENGTPVFAASPLGGEPEGYLEEVLLLVPNGTHAMDLSP